MNRELRYFVAKVKDVEKYLNEDQQLKLHTLLTKIRIGRLKDEKPDVECVCVESDWPEYETVWKMIEARVDGKPNELKRLRAENERLKAELAEVKKDASRLEFITESCWFVVWRKNPHEPKKYRMICDGEPWGKLYKTAREAIDAAMKGK